MNPKRFFIRPLWILLFLLALSLCACAEREEDPLPTDSTVQDGSDPTAGERTERVSVRQEVLPYQTLYCDSDSLYVGEERQQTQGKEGYCIYEYREILIDGVCVESERRETERVEAIDAVILRGTKPKTTPTGTFRHPVSSKVTSPYGWRVLNGVREFHYGIDLRAAVGTSIAAADGGVVVYAGTPDGISASYGKLIIIDHQNGYKTYYAHLSSFSVRVGDAVAQGQMIGRSGITGNVTGPHLHFEIRYNNQTKNPLLYLT